MVTVELVELVVIFQIKNNIYYFSGRSEKHRDITIAQILYGMFKEEYSIEYLLKEFKNKNSLWSEHTYPAISSRLFLLFIIRSF